MIGLKNWIDPLHRPKSFIGQDDRTYMWFFVRYIQYRSLGCRGFVYTDAYDADIERVSKVLNHLRDKLSAKLNRGEGI